MVLFIYLFLNFYFIFGSVGSLLLRGLSLVAVSGGYSLLWCAGFSLQWPLLLRSSGSRHTGFSSCGSWAPEHRLSTCGTWGLVAPRHVGSSRTRAGTRVPCSGRHILNHCATREALKVFLELWYIAEKKNIKPK